MIADAPGYNAGRRCPVSNKRSYPNVAQARTHAKAFSRHLNARGDISQSLYTYECPDCAKVHLTRHATWGGEELHQVFQAPSAELQSWAMTGGGTPLPESARPEIEQKEAPRHRPRRRGGPDDMAA